MCAIFCVSYRTFTKNVVRSVALLYYTTLLCDSRKQKSRVLDSFDAVLTEGPLKMTSVLAKLDFSAKV